MAIYDFRAQFTPYSEGYPGETTGCEGGDTSWVPGDSMTGTRTATYYYRDTNRADLPVAQYDRYASEVRIKVKDSWTVKQLSDNRLEITLETDIVDIWRYLPAGNGSPIYSGMPYWRNVVFYNNREDAIARRSPIKQYMQWRLDDYSHKEPYMNIPSRKIYLNPGESSTVVSSLFLHSWAAYNGGDLWHRPDQQDQYNDSMGVGVAFRNNLQKGFGHCIHYDANGGRDAPSDYCWTDEEECTDFTISSKEPWSPHWVFLGWSTNKNATSPQYRAGQTITVCDEMTLYAVYRYTYRPGMVRLGGVFYSCDRDGASGPLGRCNVRRGGKWIEMRIDPINSGLSDPPDIVRGGSWQIMKLIGQDGVPHHITWDCPHQWN